MWCIQEEPRTAWTNNRRGCVVTLVKEVDGFHTGILLVTDLQLVKLAKQVYQPLHNLHAILTEAEESDTDFSNTLDKKFWYITHNA